ncbi:unnamed protein product [Caenorhabditis auriculariae]|uniref:Uncharacterized protein n=1 Tax=Caenorhabditis auriculariae TaxID=2777116 RepID=A0A8S1HCB9_9PELO|nr:unnamed protein product [Caenorhabditis auriculariae]
MRTLSSVCLSAHILPRSRDFFIREVCARMERLLLNSLWVTEGREKRNVIKVRIVRCINEEKLPSQTNCRSSSFKRVHSCEDRALQDFYHYYSGEKVAHILTVFVGGNHEEAAFRTKIPTGETAPNILQKNVNARVRNPQCWVADTGHFWRVLLAPGYCPEGSSSNLLWRLPGMFVGMVINRQSNGPDANKKKCWMRCHLERESDVLHRHVDTKPRGFFVSFCRRMVHADVRWAGTQPPVQKRKARIAVLGCGHGQLGLASVQKEPQYISSYAAETSSHCGGDGDGTPSSGHRVLTILSFRHINNNRCSSDKFRHSGGVGDRTPSVGYTAYRKINKIFFVSNGSDASNISNDSDVCDVSNDFNGSNDSTGESGSNASTGKNGSDASNISNGSDVSNDSIGINGFDDSNISNDSDVCDVSNDFNGSNDSTGESGSNASTGKNGSDASNISNGSDVSNDSTSINGFDDSKSSKNWFENGARGQTFRANIVVHQNAMLVGVVIDHRSIGARQKEKGFLVGVVIHYRMNQRQPERFKMQQHHCTTSIFVFMRRNRLGPIRRFFRINEHGNSDEIGQLEPRSGEVSGRASKCRVSGSSTTCAGGNHKASGRLAELPDGGWVAPNIPTVILDGMAAPISTLFIGGKHGTSGAKHLQQGIFVGVVISRQSEQKNAVLGCGHGFSDPINSRLATFAGRSETLNLGMPDWKTHNRFHCKRLQDLAPAELAGPAMKTITRRPMLVGVVAPILTVFVGGNHEVSGFLVKIPTENGYLGRDGNARVISDFFVRNRSTQIRQDEGAGSSSDFLWTLQVILVEMVIGHQRVAVRPQLFCPSGTSTTTDGHRAFRKSFWSGC